jgi:acetyl-CoA acetyltransferase
MPGILLTQGTAPMAQFSESDPIVILSYARTPMGAMQGALADASATDLGATAVKAAVERAGVNGEDIDRVYMGCVLPAGLGQAPARQAALKAGLPKSAQATTVNKVCGSGMQTVIMGAEALASGAADLIVAGGMESMTNAPYLLKKHRSGARIGHDTAYDHMFLDGLEDAYEEGKAMGSFAQCTADEYQLTREDMDQFAITSLSRASAAISSGAFAGEVVPVTVKTRKGIDEDHLTFLEAGRIAADCGVAAIALHGRTAIQGYSGQADWDSIAELVAGTSIPVLGNGDIWEASDARRMVAQTGVAGVVVGRGCLGRPWLFRDLAGEFAGNPSVELPRLGEVAAMMRRHAELLARYQGEERGCKEFRKHVSWYLKGFRAGGELRHALALIGTLAELDGLLGKLDPDEPFPVGELGHPRGRQGAPRRSVVLPQGWLDARDDVVHMAPEETHEAGGG